MIDLLYDINAASKWRQITALSQKRSLNWFIQNSWFVHEQARMGHWITEPILSNPWIRSVFSVLLRDVRNSSCGLNRTVGSRAENITKYRML